MHGREGLVLGALLLLCLALMGPLGARAADTTPPTITAVSPPAGATRVSRAASVTVAFSEPMSPTSLNTSTVTLVRHGTSSPLAATVTYSATTRQATLNPSAQLLSLTKYVATVKGGSAGAKDAAGNSLASSKVWSFTTEDAVAPTVTAVSPLSGATSAARNTLVAATFSEAMDPASLTTSSLTLARYGTTTRLAATISYDAATRRAILDPSSDLLSQTKYTATVKGGSTGARDLQGNPLGSDKVWSFTTADTTAPVITSVQPAAGATLISATSNVVAQFSEPMAASSLTTSSFTLLSEGATTPVPAAVTYGTTTHKATLNPDATLQSGARYTATVKGGSAGARDASGNPLASNKVWSFTVADTTPPVVTGTSPADGSKGVPLAANVEAAFSEAMSPATLTASTVTLLREETTTPLAASVSYDPAAKKVVLNPSADLVQGDVYTATIKGGSGGAADTQGNPLARSLSWSFAALDAAPPTVLGVSPAPGATRVPRGSSLEVQFSERMDPASITTASVTLLRASTGVPVAASVRYDATTRKATLNPGSDLANEEAYSATVRGGGAGVKDRAGNPLPADKLWSFTTADTIVPNTRIDSGPSGAVSSSSATFSFAASEPNSTLACSLDGAAFTACTSPRTYAALAEGAHTFSMRATDASGNTDATPSSRTWTVDTIVPDTAVTAGPPSPSNSPTAAFTLGATEAGVAYKCSLDGSAFTSCASPRTYTALPDGVHLFRARAADAAGNTDPTPAEWRWSTDTLPPDTAITSGPIGWVRETTAAFGFGATEAGVALECSLDGAPYSACASPKTYSALAQGAHTFRVRSRDAAGNTDPTPAARTWTVDTAPPDTALQATTTGASASFTLSSTETETAFACSLDGAPYVECASPQEYTGLVSGEHTFRAYSTDQAGNTDPTPAAHTWTVPAP